MDRARRTAATTRRKTLGDSTSPQPTVLDMASDHHHVAGSPVMAHASTATISPQTGSRSRRGSKTLQQPFTFSTPAPVNRGQVVKKRPRTMDGNMNPADDDFDDDSPRKGGHTLRKRARVDYTFEHVDDEVIVPSSTSSRSRKRRSDNSSYESEDFHGAGTSRRRASMGADSSANLRRNPARKSAVGSTDHGDDEDVKDTIEVGVTPSEVDESEGWRASHSSASSAEQSHDGSRKSAPATSTFGSMFPEKHNTNGFTHDEDGKLDFRNENIDPQLLASPTAPSEQPRLEQTVAQAQEMKQETAREPVPDAAIQMVTTTEATTASDSKQPSMAVATSQATQEAVTVETVSDQQREDCANKSVEESNPPLLDNGLRLDGKDKPSENEDPAGGIAEKTVSEQSVPEPISVEHSSPQSRDVLPSASSPSKETLGEAERQGETGRQGDSAGVIAEETLDITKRSMSREIPSISVESAIEPDKADETKGKDQAVPKSDQGRAGKNQPSTADSKLAVEAKEKASANPETTSSLDNRDLAQPKRPSQLGPSKPQPAPTGRWAHLTPYMDGEYVSYPEKKAGADDEAGGDDAIPEDRDADKDGGDNANDMEPLVEDNSDAPDSAGNEAQTPALNTPLRGTPVPDSMDPTAANSPAPAGEDAEEGDMSDSQEQPERRRCFKYRKLRDADEFISALEHYDDMTTAELHEVLGAINISLVQWQTEWNDLGKVVDDYENSLRRRAADAKYESRTRSLSQHGVNHEEPDFVVKGYKAKERDLMSETRYLQGQDRIMAATYGFEYDPHPSKIGRQNPETQQVGIMTRGRSLRNQPRQTVKASEADEVVTGKRQRKPIQLLETAAQDASRSSTPVPARGRRRRNPNADDDTQVAFVSSFNGDGISDAESAAPKTRRRRGPRASQAAANAAPEELETPRGSGAVGAEETGRSGRRRARHPVKYDETLTDFLDGDDSQPEPKPQRKRHLLTLKIPRAKNFSEPSSAITDNGDSRPSTASSDSSSHTAESSYSFRPKRQKRFRDDAEEGEEAAAAAAQAPPRKRGKRSHQQEPVGGGGGDDVDSSFMLKRHVPDAPQSGTVRKVQKIKVVRASGDNTRVESSSPAMGGDGDDKPKDYKNMTKSEKMSASMKSRWANGNMAGAVEKRKATLAAKKAAQVAADQKIGSIAPKPKNYPNDKELFLQGQPRTGAVLTMPSTSHTFSTKH